MSYLVSQSTHDIGVRVALGAQPGEHPGAGGAAGDGTGGYRDCDRAGWRGGMLTRVMASLLFGVSATDAVTFGAVAVMLAAVAFAATAIPARRATSVDPMVALRDE